MKGKKEISDEDIIRDVMSGKSDRFSQLYDRYAQKVYGKCISLLGDTELAQDATHDIFIKIFTGLSKFQFKSKFSTWLYSITYNFCIDLIKKRKKIVKVRTDELNNTKSDDYESVAEVSDAELFSIKAEVLKDVLDEIGIDDKSILLMKYQQELPIKEIMEILNISESATKMRIKRAKFKAIQIYKEKFEKIV